MTEAHILYGHEYVMDSYQFTEWQLSRLNQYGIVVSADEKPLVFEKNLSKDEMGNVLNIIWHADNAVEPLNEHTDVVFGYWFPKAEELFGEETAWTIYWSVRYSRAELVFDEIKKRCAAANIRWEKYESYLPIGQSGSPGINIIPSAEHGEQKLFVIGEDQAKSLLAVQFENYCLLAGPAAIANYKEGTIECGVQSLQGLTNEAIRDRFLGKSSAIPPPSAWPGISPKTTSDEKAPTVNPYSGLLNAFASLHVRSAPQIQEISSDLSIVVSAGGVTISIGECTQEYKAFISTLIRPPGLPTLKISGLRITKHNDALVILHSVSNSLFFQIERTRSLALGLVRGSKLGQPSLTSPQTPPNNIAFPNSKYDHEAISLYWFAKSARGLPLTQYLAYYQCIEYYFPRYSQIDAVKRLGIVVADPAFSPHRESDLLRALRAAKGSGNRSNAPERSQIQSVVINCIDADAFKSLIRSLQKTEEFLRTDKHLSKQRVSMDKEASELLNDVAMRIYEIRCRIVHTKDGDENERPILPFSQEERMMSHDIALIEYIAQQVLIASSQALSLSL